MTNNYYDSSNTRIQQDTNITCYKIKNMGKYIIFARSQVSHVQYIKTHNSLTQTVILAIC